MFEPMSAGDLAERRDAERAANATLRDDFAKIALAEFLQHIPDSGQAPNLPDLVAADAYRFADAMMTRRAV